MEVIRMFLSYALSKNITMYQMNVKPSFLNGDLEEVYIEQPEGFPLLDNKYYVYKLKKDLYG